MDHLGKLDTAILQALSVTHQCNNYLTATNLVQPSSDLLMSHMLCYSKYTSALWCGLYVFAYPAAYPGRSLYISQDSNPVLQCAPAMRVNLSVVLICAEPMTLSS